MNAPAARGNFLRKITPKTVMAKVSGDQDYMNKLGATRPVPARTLYDLFGQISRAKVGTTDKGEYVQFKGRFVAVTPDGEEFMSGAAHIPVMEDMLYAGLQDALATDPKAVVEVAVRVGIVPADPTKPSATGYEYDVQRLIEHSDASDPIARMRQEVAAKALPAPTPAASVSSDKVPDVKPEHHRAGARRR